MDGISGVAGGPKRTARIERSPAGFRPGGGGDRARNVRAEAIEPRKPRKSLAIPEPGSVATVPGATIADGPAKVLAPKQAWLERIKNLVREANFESEPGARWSRQDLAEFYKVVKAMPPGDRKALGDVTFERTRKISGAMGADEFGEIDFKTKNVDAYLDRLGPADVEALTQMIDRGLSKEEIKRMSESNAKLARTGEFPRADGDPPGM